MATNSTQRVLTFDQVRDAIANSLGLDPTFEIAPTARLVELCDSLERVQLILDLEEDFSCEISDEDLARLFTVDDIVKYLNAA